MTPNEALNKMASLAELQQRIGRDKFNSRWNLGYRGATLFRGNLDLLPSPPVHGETHQKNREEKVASLVGTCITCGYDSDMAAQVLYQDWQRIGKALGMDKVSQDTIDAVVLDLYKTETWKDRLPKQG